MDELINIIIPVYNAEGFLDRCLKSIVEQEYKNLRIILVEDCSKDSSRSICEKWVSKDSRIELVSLDKNGGSANARNQGLNRVDFDNGYVAFVDADDYLHPTYFVYLYNLLKKYDADFSWCGVHNTFEKDKMDFDDLKREDNEYTLTGKELLLREDLRVMYSMVWGKLFKGFLWKDVRFDTKYTYFQDGGTTFRAIYLADKVAISQRALYNYYYSANSATRSKVNKKKLVDGIETGLDKIKFYGEHNEKQLQDMAYVGYLNTLLKWCREIDASFDDKNLYKKVFADYKANYMRAVKNKDLPIKQRMKYVIYRFFPHIQKYYINIKMRAKGYK